MNQQIYWLELINDDFVLNANRMPLPVISLQKTYSLKFKRINNTNIYEQRIKVNGEKLLQ